MTIMSLEEVNYSALAKQLRATRESVRNWVREGMPAEEGAEACREWLKAKRAAAKSRSEEASDAQERKLLAEARKLLAEAEAKELKTEQLRGELLDRQETELGIAEAFTMVKAALEAFPETIAYDCLPVESREIAKERWEDCVRLLLVKLSQLEIKPPEEPEE